VDEVLFRQVLCIEKHTQPWSTRRRIFEASRVRSAGPQLRAASFLSGL
jgi:hypothetical protein